MVNKAIIEKVITIIGLARLIELMAISMKEVTGIYDEKAAMVEIEAICTIKENDIDGWKKYPRNAPRMIRLGNRANRRKMIEKLDRYMDVEVTNKEIEKIESGR